MRRYSTGARLTDHSRRAAAPHLPAAAMVEMYDMTMQMGAAAVVGRCSLAASTPELKAPMVSVLETEIS